MDMGEPVVADNASAQLAALRALHAVSKRVHASLDLTETLDAIAQGVVEATCFGVAVVNLATGEDLFEVVAAAGDESARATLLGTAEPIARWRQLEERAERWADLRFLDHRNLTGVDDDMTSWVPEIEPLDDPNAWHPLDTLYAPLLASTGEWLGTLCVDLPAGGIRPGPSELELLGLFAEHAAIAIDHARMHETLRLNRDELEYAATHDGLTGVANRALLMSRGPELAADPNGELGVLVLDLDGFKALNDSAGHLAGDRLLAVLAARMQACVRGTDLVARSGGDEFVIVLSGPSVVPAMRALATRLEAVLTAPVRLAAGLHRVGVSIGTAVEPTPIPFERVLAAADTRMYEAKKRRR